MVSGRPAVDLPLDWVLGGEGDRRKVFELTTLPSCQWTAASDGRRQSSLTVEDALSRVLLLPAVASKRYLTAKVDRSVTGLVAQQQCVGPLHTPLADVAVTALSFFAKVRFVRPLSLSLPNLSLWLDGVLVAVVCFCLCVTIC